MKRKQETSDTRFFPRQVAYLYESARVALISNAVLAPFTVWLLFELDILDDEYLFFWLASIYLIVAIRAVAAYLYSKQVKTPKVLSLYSNIFIANAVITGVLWGITPWIFASAGQVEIAVILVFVVGGLLSGATATMSVLSKVYFSYMMSVLLPMIVWFFVQDGTLYFVIALMLSFSIIGFITASLTYKKILIRSFELTEEVLKQKHQAEEASQAKSNFLSSMSHELRTPLNAILGFAQLIEIDDEVDKCAKENAQEVMSAGNYLLMLINDLLEISAIEANKVELNVSPVNATNVIDECIKMLQATSLPESNISFIKEQAGCDNLVLMADSLRLKQILTNLLSNAIKYNEAGGVVTVKCEVVDNGRGRISVTDTGLGIPLEQQEKLFSAYDRLGKEDSNIEGTGLGLMIARNLLKLMSGEIDFKSEENEGSCFWIDLPLAEIN